MQNEISKGSSTISAAVWMKWILSIGIIFSIILADKTLVAAATTPSPSSIDCKVQPYYKYRKDGKPGREITINFKGSKLYGSATIKFECNYVIETTAVNETAGVDQLSVLLPAGAGVDNE